MKETGNIGSVFAAKHIPLSLKESGVQIRYAETVQGLAEQSVPLDALLETAQQTVTEQTQQIVNPGSVIVYPGRHPESKHPMDVLLAKGIALYRMETSPWNDAVVQFALQTEQALCGNLPIHKDTLFSDMLGTIKQSEVESGAVGIIGAGDIGSGIAQAMCESGRHVLYVSRSVRPQLDAFGARRVGLKEAFSTAQSLFITLPYSLDTKNMIHGSLISQMRPNARLISVSAAGVIDENALVSSLCNGNTISVALDVYNGDISGSVLHPGNSPGLTSVYKQGRILVTPHIAYKTGESTKVLLHTMAQPILNMLYGYGLEETVIVPTPAELQTHYLKPSYTIKRTV